MKYFEFLKSWGEILRGQFLQINVMVTQVANKSRSDFVRTQADTDFSSIASTKVENVNSDSKSESEEDCPSDWASGWVKLADS